MLAAERDRECDPDRGEVVRGRYGIDVGGAQNGEMGDEGIGSVDRRTVGGFLGVLSKSGGLRKVVDGEAMDVVEADEDEDVVFPAVEKGILCRRRGGKGEDLNSSMRSVSGTGSIFGELCFLFLLCPATQP